MALDIYREVSTGTYAVYGIDGAGDDHLPIITTHDGVLGEVVEVKLFIRNDDPTEYYQGITVTPISKTSPDDTIGTESGHGVKLYRRGTLSTDLQPQPTEAEWAAIDYGAFVSFPNIGQAASGDDSSYLAFWYRVEVPAGSPADNKDNITLRLSYTAYPV